MNIFRILKRNLTPDGIWGCWQDFYERKMNYQRRKDLQQSKNKTEKETIKKEDTNITNLREIFFLILEMSHERMCLFNEGESRIYEHSHLWIFSGVPSMMNSSLGF